MHFRFLSFWVSVCAWVMMIGCAPPNEDAAIPGTSPTVVIKTLLGDIRISIDEDVAPATAANFLRYVDEELYDGGSFFRTVHANNQPLDSIRIAVVQGGARSDADGRFFEPILLERTSKTGLKHLDGTVSMARGGPDTATHSFFFCIGDQPELDFGGKRNPDGQGFAAFGQVLDGSDVIRAIQMSPHEAQRLQPTIRILSVRRE